MKNIPNKIYLQIGENPSEDDFDNFNEEEVTWSAHKFFDTDIEYSRIDLKKVRLFSEWEQDQVDINGAGDGYEALSELSKKVIDSAVKGYLTYLLDKK